MKIRLLPVLVTIHLVCLSTTTAHAECTLREKQSLHDSGMSSYEIDRICGEIKETGKDSNQEIFRPPKRPDTHGRLQENTNICQTQYIWCAVDQEGPPGTPCLCNTRYGGPLYGVLIRR